MKWSAKALYILVGCRIDYAGRPRLSDPITLTITSSCVPRQTTDNEHRVVHAVIALPCLWSRDQQF
jgi:hypothetical protein